MYCGSNLQGECRVFGEARLHAGASELQYGDIMAKLSEEGKAAILAQLGKVESSIYLYLNAFISSEELVKALRIVRKMRKRLEK